MQSQLTVRLPDDLKEEITRIAKRYHLKRSDIVRMALERVLEEFREKERIMPYDRTKDLIGSISSGIPDLGESHRKHLLKKIKKNA
ncbi:MAG: ribbon-helix-helix protein, CopG family [Nitrospirae bacterium]|nr:ribbon-helix-helix protein, CopG family [Nitrospirota bacterium]